jgi:ElaB/YqjD/DUF883 family membrane-anchored ribosome-binding protein
MSSRIEDVAVDPQTVDEAKDAVERSRQRISTTLDALEDRIVEKKHAMQDRMDVLRPVRDQVTQRPFMAVAVALGVGAVLGSLGGSAEDVAEPRAGRGRQRLSDHDRRELRQWRRLRRDRLRARGGSGGHDDDSGARLDSLKHQLAGAVTTAIGAAVTARLKEFSSKRDDGRVR